MRMPASNLIATKRLTMKRVLVLTVALFLCFFGMAVAAGQGVPDLRGKWTVKVSEFHVKGMGYLKEGITGDMEITEQKERILLGNVTWMVHGMKHPGFTGFSGVFDRDNINAYIAGENGCIRFLHVESPDLISMYVLHPGGEQSCAGYVEFVRVKE